MRHDTAAILAQRIDEVALWCSLQELSAFHQDSPDQARRRELLKEANRLATAGYNGDSWLQRFLPNGRRWARAMNLIKEADPDSLAPLEHQLRSSKLKPTDSIGSSYSEESIQEIVNGVIDLRSSLIKSQLFREHTTPPSQLRGRFLLYIPSENVSDGASRFASNGFFDAYDCPPWDLWIRYSDRTLISWVPEVLFPLAQAGIEANPIDCIRWTD
jgi:hypothetical protein